MTKWLESQWRAFSGSYERSTAAVQSSPVAILIGPGTMVLGLLLLAHVPALAAMSGFREPYVPITLFALGALCTLIAWRRNASGRLGTACMLLDTACYSAALSFATMLTAGAFSIGFAVALGLCLVALPGSFYALTLPIAVAMCGPPVLAMVVVGAGVPVIVILWCACALALITSYRTGQRRSLLRQNERLRAALGAADRVADQRLELALAASLLEIGNFLHELRNTRAASRANLHFVLESAGLEPEVRAAIEDALQAQEHEDQLIAALVTDLRSKGRTGGGWFLVQELVDRFATEGTPPPEIRVVDQSQPFNVEGNPEHMRLVLSNLARNAEQAGAAKMTLRIAPDADACCVVIEVADDGPGLPPEVVRDPFRPFGNSRNGGMGLGLYLARRYVEMMGGRIEVVDGKTGGATFRIRVPGRIGDATAGGRDAAS